MPEVPYPICVDRWLHCIGQCKKVTKQEVRIYPDVEHYRCTVCGHKHSVRFDREVAVVYTEVDQTQLEGILQDISVLSNAIGIRNWGHMGKKDQQFLDNTVLTLNMIARRVNKLLGK